MTTISISPQYPIPGRVCNIIFTKSISNTNFFRVWVTVAPTDSELYNSIKNDKDPRNRFEVYSGSGGTDFPLSITLDKGGKYTFVAQEYVKGSGYGGAYEGDPNGSELEVKNGSEVNLYVFVGQRMTQVIGPPNYRATLNLYVWDDTIRATYRSIHGEDTPSITANPATDKVKSAIESTTVKSYLSALAGLTVSTAIGNLSAMVPEYHTNWKNHLLSSTFHNQSDSLNELDVSLLKSYTSNTLTDFVNKAITNQRYHFLDDTSLDGTITPPNPIGPGLGEFHTVQDRQNLSLYQSVGGFDEAYGAFVDLLRTCELHRVDTSEHLYADDVHVTSELSPLMKVHREYLSIVASPNPPAPPAQSSGAQLLISGAGFKEE